MLKKRKWKIFLLMSVFCLFSAGLNLYADDDGDDGDSDGSWSSGGDDDSDGGGWWDSYESEPEDGWDGTSNTGWDFNDDIEWSDENYWDGVDWDTHTYTSTDGVIGYDDVFDSEGNVIYHNDDPDVQARVEEFFSDMRTERGNSDSSYYATKLSDAIKAYEQVKNTENPAWIESARINMENARSALDQFCKDHEYSWSAKGNSVSVKNENGLIVAHAGDPVVLWSGQFVIDDVDAVITYGKMKFPIKRHYRTPETFELPESLVVMRVPDDSETTEEGSGDEEDGDEVDDDIKNLIEEYEKNGEGNELGDEENSFNSENESQELELYQGEFLENDYCIRKTGAFGNNWYSTFDTRIIRGYLNEIIPEKTEREHEYLEKIESAEEEIRGYAEEDSVCSVILDLTIELKEAEVLKADEVKNFYDKNQEVMELNRYVEYGTARKVAGRLGYERLIYCPDDDSMILFQQSESGEYIPVADSWKNTLKMETLSEGFKITDLKTGEIRCFTKYGLPYLFTYSTGEKVEFIYDDDFRLRKIVLNNKKNLNCIWKDEKISCIEFDGRKIQYRYDGEKLSGIVDDDGNIRRFEYDENGFIDKQVKADGSFIGFEYAEINGKKFVSATINEEGFRETFEYDLPQRKTVYKNQDGEIFTYFYDENNRTVLIENPDGTEERFYYDDSGFVFKKSTGENEFTFAYDTAGHMIEKKYMDGSSEKYLYNGDLPSGIIKRNGGRTDFAYDSSGNLTEMYFSGERVYSFSYNGERFLESAVDYAGNRTVYAYDGNGNLISRSLFGPEKTGTPYVERWTYDEKNRVKEHYDLSQTLWKYEYKPGEVSITNDGNVRVKRTYSPRKLLLGEIIEDIVTGEKRCREFSYDKNGHCKEIYVSGIDTSGKIYKKQLYQTYSWSPAGKITSEILWNSFSYDDSFAENKTANGWKKEYFYDSCGELASIKNGLCDERGKFITFKTSILKKNKVSGGYMISDYSASGNYEYFYDNENNLVEKILNGTVLVRNDYSSGKLISSKNSPYGSLFYRYDSENGFLNGMKGETGEFTEVDFFPDGKIKSSKDKNGMSSVFKYDACGRIIEISNPSKKVLYTPDVSGRIQRMQLFDAEGNIVREEEWIYSKDGRTVNHISGGKYSETLTHNAFGNLLTKTDAEKNTVTSIYDVLGRKISEKNPYGKSTLLYYNGRNKVIKEILPDGSSLRYRYDRNMNCIEVADEEGVVLKQSYDDAGRILSKGKRPFLQETFFEYDDFGRIVRTVQNGRAVVTEIYDDNGRTKKWKAGSNTSLEYGFDAEGKVLWKSNSYGKRSSYSYNSNGTIKERSDFEGKSARYVYEHDGLSCSISYSDGTFSRYLYSVAGDILQAENENSFTEYSYDSAGKLVVQKDKKTGLCLNFEYDSRGLLTEITDGKRRISYSYGKTKELKKITDSIIGKSASFNTEIAFDYDDIGRETFRLWKNGQSLKTVYDRAGRVVLKAGYAPDMGVIHLEGYVYDVNGFISLSLNADEGVTKYLYDEEGRVSEIVYPYSEEKAKLLKNQLKAFNVAVHSDETKIVMNPFTSSEISQIQKLYAMTDGRYMQYSSRGSYIKEKLRYDENSNIVMRETPYGNVKFIYDKENRLVEWGNGCVADYDSNGNLVLRKDAFRTEKISYDFFNRMKKINVLDSEKDTGVAEEFLYDCFGRRIAVLPDSSPFCRMDYIGFTDRPFYINYGGYNPGEISQTTGSALRLKSNVMEEKFRYRWEENKSQSNSFDRAFRQKEKNVENHSKIHDDVLISNKAPLFKDLNSMLSVYSLEENRDEKNFVIFESINGSVMKMLSDAGLNENMNYDVFGNPVGDGILFGYAGKLYDRNSGTYDFGQRDFMPNFNRFSTLDPTCDGRNWYAYCPGDFVNFVDRNGFAMLGTQEQDMQGMGKGTLLGNSSSDKASDQGCLVTAIAEALTALTGVVVTPSSINNEASNFGYLSGNISWEDISSNYGLVHTSNSVNALVTSFMESFTAMYGTGAFADFFDNTDGGIATVISNYIDSLMRAEEDIVLIAQVVYTSDHHTHFVTVSGNVTTKDGINYIPIVPTSVNDKSVSASSLRGQVGWIQMGGKIYVPVSNVRRLDTLSKNN